MLFCAVFSSGPGAMVSAVATALTGCFEAGFPVAMATGFSLVLDLRALVNFVTVAGLG